MNTNFYSNAFLDLSGMPYLLGEYTNKDILMQLDRSLVKNEINIDVSEAMNAFIDVNIDCIGRRVDGLLQVEGNCTKQKRLIDITYQNANTLQHQFDVIRSGIVIMVNYQLENSRTRQIIRSAQETLKVNTRSYFLDINPLDINDNAIVTNFYDQMVSTINQFTHGTDRMILRITNIQLFYECTKRCENTYNECGSTYPPTSNVLCENKYIPNMHYNNQYRYQPQCEIGYNKSCCPTPIPQSWLTFNHFYRFEEYGHRIVLHENEIYDMHTSIFLLPCGNIHVDRSFIINPGQRLIFKFNIWKNDLTMVDDTIEMAKAIGAVIDLHPPCPPPIHPYPPYPYPPCPEYDKTITDKYQQLQLNELYEDLRVNDIEDDNRDIMINSLWDAVKALQNGDPPISPPILPEVPEVEIDRIQKIIKEIFYL